MKPRIKFKLVASTRPFRKRSHVLQKESDVSKTGTVASENNVKHMEDAPPFLTRKDIYFRFGIHPYYLEKWTRQGMLKEFRYGRFPLYMEHDVVSAIKTQKHRKSKRTLMVLNNG